MDGFVVGHAYGEETREQKTWIEVICWNVSFSFFSHRSFLLESNRLQLLRDVITENKELVIAPTFTLVPQLFSLPIFFASLLLACQTIETSPIRYLFITSCFAAFIPQFLTFFLYIKPSSFYSKQWHSTDLNQRIAGWTKFHRSQTTTKSNGMLSKVHRWVEQIDHMLFLIRKTKCVLKFWSKKNPDRFNKGLFFWKSCIFSIAKWE